MKEPLQVPFLEIDTVVLGVFGGVEEHDPIGVEVVGVACLRVVLNGMPNSEVFCVLMDAFKDEHPVLGHWWQREGERWQRLTRDEEEV